MQWWFMQPQYKRTSSVIATCGRAWNAILIGTLQSVVNFDIIYSTFDQATMTTMHRNKSL